MHDIDHAGTGDLADTFRVLFDRADDDQWDLAHIAFAATKRSGTTVEGFAEMVGKAPGTIRKYRIAYAWRQRNLHDHADARFTDVAALMIKADLDEFDLETATQECHRQAVDAVRELIIENPDLMIEAMKDDATRSVLIAQAFEAEQNEIVGAAERITRDAADGRSDTGSVKTRLAVFQGDAEGPMAGIARDLQKGWPRMSGSDREAVRSFIKKFEVRLRGLRVAARF